MNWNRIILLTEPFVPEILRNLELIVRIFVAMILGMLIGNERKNRMKSAGMRTHALVALGSALVMVVSKYGFADSIQGGGAETQRNSSTGIPHCPVVAIGATGHPSCAPSNPWQPLICPPFV